MQNFQKTFISILVGFSLALLTGFVITTLKPGVSYQEDQKCYENSSSLYDKSGPQDVKSSETKQQEKEAQECSDELEARRSYVAEHRSYALFLAIGLVAASYTYMAKNKKFDAVIADGIGYGLIFICIYTIAIASSGTIYGGNSKSWLGLVAAALTFGSSLLVANMSLIRPAKETTKK